MGWFAVLAFVVVAVGIIWRVGHLSRKSGIAALVAGLIAIAGYIWQGQPAAPGVPAAVLTKTMSPRDEDAALLRATLFDRYGDTAQVIEFADTMQRLGRTRESIIVVQTALRKTPNNANLWVALGNALVVHGDGISPAAEFAFARGASLAPTSPAPQFYLGQALAESGRLDDAARVWADLFARTPPTATWREPLALRLAMLAMVARRTGWDSNPR